MGVASIGACSSPASDATSHEVGGASGEGTSAAGTSAAGTSAAGTSAAGTSAAGSAGGGTSAAGSNGGGTAAAGSAGGGTAGAGTAGGPTLCSFITGECNSCIPDKCAAEGAACLADTNGCYVALGDLSVCVCGASNNTTSACLMTLGATGTLAKALADCSKAKCATECGL
ncbi:MAG: hypothetical protein ABI488_13740 [Polyangiaceae bacterium]